MSKYHSLFEPGKTVETVGGQLVDEFGMPPFSIFDARSGAWQARKSAWLSLGIKSEVGRGENLLKMSDTILEPDPEKRRKLSMPVAGRKVGQKTAGAGLTIGITMSPYAPQASYGEAAATGTSIFDPVLCELFYRWFVPAGGTIFDPFAGGSVRGIVASRLGYRYHGIDLRGEQVLANEEQAAVLCESAKPRWYVGDSQQMKLFDKHGLPKQVDAIFSCPPYFDLEKYSDNRHDLSNMEYPDFMECYVNIIEQSAERLKDNRFACFVVGEVRHKKTGMCRGFVTDTILAFEKAGLSLYNDAILITSIGSLSIRAGAMFRGSRKLGRTHQYVLIFAKGDPKKAVAAIEGA